MTENNPWPRISIVTPSYNQDRYLEKTILSVIDQEYPNLEYIIIDGGSKDRSIEIIKKYEKFIHFWVSEPDQGQSDAIRKGFQVATGDIFSWINSDDIYEPDSFKKVAKTFLENENTDVVYGYIWWINEEDEKIHHLKFPPFDFETLVYVSGCLHQTGTFWTQKIYHKISGVDIKYQFCMDYDLFCRMGEIGNFLCLPEYLACFRIHGKSKSSTMLEIAQLEHEEIQNRYIPPQEKTIVKGYKKFRSELRRANGFLKMGELSYLLERSRKRIKKTVKSESQKTAY